MSPGHTMHVTFQRDVVHLKPVCHEPNDAPCHLMCPEGCEEWGPDHEHQLEPTDICNAVEWLTADGAAEEMCGETREFPLFNGMPIDVTWNGATYTWSPMRNQPADGAE